MVKKLIVAVEKLVKVVKKLDAAVEHFLAAVKNLVTTKKMSPYVFGKLLAVEKKYL